MYTRLKAICPFRDTFKVINLFGYATKSFPGVEVNGLGRYGKSLKEKFIYLAKEMDIKIPIKRIVLCVEEEDAMNELSNEEKAWIELPLMILFLSLIQHISIGKLDDCFSMGKVSVVGKIIQFELDSEQFSEILKSNNLENLKYISYNCRDLPRGLKVIELDKLINHSEKIEFLNESLENVHLRRMSIV